MFNVSRIGITLIAVALLVAIYGSGGTRVEASNTTSYTATWLTIDNYNSVTPQYMTPGGQVTGTALTNSGNIDAFFYDNSSGMHDLALPNSTSCSVVGGDATKAINSSGNVIGQCTLIGDYYHGFVYNSTGLHDLTFGEIPNGHSTVMTINTVGQVLGQSTTSKTIDYYLYTPDASGGTMTDLTAAIAALGWSSITITTFNDAAQVIGQGSNPSSQQHAFRYDSSANTIIDLGTLGGSKSYPNAINSSGDVVGSAYTTNDAAQHAFLYSHSTGKMKDLGVIGGGTYSEATAINNAGQVAGTGTDSSGNSYAFLYNSKGIHQLTLGGRGSSLIRLTSTGVVIGSSDTTGSVRGDLFIYDSAGIHDVFLSTTGSIAYVASNDAGQVVGYATDSSGQTKGYFATGGTTTELTLGGSQSVAFAINKSGQVVGYSSTTNDTSADAFIYSNGAITDLNGHVNGEVAGDSIGQATAISDGGEILVQATIGGQNGWFVLRPRVDLDVSISGPATALSGFSFPYTITASNDGPTQAADVLVTDTLPSTLSFVKVSSSAATCSQASGTVTCNIGALNAQSKATITLTVKPTVTGTVTDMASISDNGNGIDIAASDTTASLTTAITTANLAISPTTLVGACQSATGTLTIGVAQAAAVTFRLTNTNTALTAPASVTVAAGKTQATFSVMAKKAVASTVVGSLTAKLGTGATNSVSLSVRPIGVASLGLVPNPVVRPNRVTGTVNLECAAGPSSITVGLTSSNTQARITDVNGNTITQITIPVGSQTGTFYIDTSQVTSAGTSTITATANSIGQSVVLTIQ